MLYILYCLNESSRTLILSARLFFFKQKTAYEMRISDWSSDVCSSDLPRDHIAIRPANLHLRARIEHQEAFAVGVRLHLPDEIEIDDRRAMDALEAPRIEALFQILHRFAQDQRVVARLDAHVIVSRLDAFGLVGIEAEALAAHMYVEW